MSNLLIDQGNTRLKAAWADQGELKFLGGFDDPQLFWRQLEQAPDHIWISSVSDLAAQTRLRQSLGDFPTQRTHWVTIDDYFHHQPTDYHPQQLGIDRWLAVLGCRSMHTGPGVVVDCGTAITLDLVDAEGKHVGGYILPGLRLASSALLSGTAIPTPDRTTPQSMPATDTASAIALGQQMAVAALIEQQLARLSDSPNLFIGGGDAQQISQLIRVPAIHVEQMVLLGLAELASREQS